MLPKKENICGELMNTFCVYKERQNEAFLHLERPFREPLTPFIFLVCLSDTHGVEFLRIDAVQTSPVLSTLSTGSRLG